MSLSLKQSQAIGDLAAYLYPFLPGTPHPYANQAISFAGVAHDFKLEGYWPSGSKLPAVTSLLSKALEFRPTQFCPLIVEIVRRGMSYRQSRNPITREEIEELNRLIEQVGFKIPELVDRSFLDGLPRTPQPNGPRVAVDEKQLVGLQNRLIALSNLEPRSRGLEFEAFLGELFELFELAPRGAFRLIGEQIDGSFQFQGETYLVEAKWQSAPIGQEDLLAFSGKVGGKAQWSRGLFICMSRFTEEGLDGFGRGKRTNIVCMDGLDLYHVLQGRLDLRAVLERKVRRAAETNQAFVPIRELFPHVV